MPYEELLGWKEYLDKNPAGWREDYRAAMIVRSFSEVSQKDLFRMFPSLDKMNNSGKKELVNKNSVAAMLMRNAVGGVKLHED